MFKLFMYKNKFTYKGKRKCYQKKLVLHGKKNKYYGQLFPIIPTFIDEGHETFNQMCKNLEI